LLRGWRRTFFTAIRSGEHPDFAYLHADAILLAGDSISMVSEASATGKPVHGITRPFSGRTAGWSDTVSNETTRNGAALQALALGRRKQA
jgi:hypothetical protein